MAELVNTFSWSISAKRDFAECPRRRYWAKYAMWGGWKEKAPDEQRIAYRLSKMRNRFTLLGAAVEQAVLWMLREARRGGQPDAEQAYEQAARPFLNRCWLDSRKRLWERNPKKFCNLHEHYYPASHKTPEKEMTQELAKRAKLCLENFLAAALPRLVGVKQEQEIPIASIECGDPESMELDGLKVYAIPDYAYRKDGLLHIHDWKAGQPKPEHREQMMLYALWAKVKHGAEPEEIRITLEYLLSGESEPIFPTEADLQAVRDTMRESVGEMSEYLVECDIGANRPLPKEEWFMTEDRAVCRKCNFYELCEGELRQGS